VCGSQDVDKVNTFKHVAWVCNDCNSVTHEKKRRYFTEYLVPRAVAKRLLPPKAFLRLFRDTGDFTASDFYDTQSFESTDALGWRRSEVEQVLDQLASIDFDLKGKRILDISGGPGHVAAALQKRGATVTVTEFSAETVQRMAKHYPVQSAVFDYTHDTKRLSEIVEGPFDLIMIRSSIIFCQDLQGLVGQLRLLAHSKSIVFIESILPTLGEVLWWQQLEYKFPVIYSQPVIEKAFALEGFRLLSGYRDYGSYSGVKWRSYHEMSRRIFTWLIEYPLVLAYYVAALFRRTAIDQSLEHKMITQFWIPADGKPSAPYRNFTQGVRHQSKTFGYIYNGYLSSSQKSVNL
jgi:hypothetical protein